MAAGAEQPRRAARSRCRSWRCAPAARRCCRRARSGRKLPSNVRQRGLDARRAGGVEDQPRRRRESPDPSSADGRSSHRRRAAPSRRIPHCACMIENEASLQTAPMSPKWLASRSSSAISARRKVARGGTLTSSATSTARECRGIGDRAVAGGAAGEPRGLLEVGAGHERLDPLVHIAQALLEPHHRLAVGGEQEMAGLDDAGMHRPDRDLVQALALGRQEGVGRARRRGVGPRRERCRTSQKPRSSHGRGSGSQANRLDAGEVAQRALQGGSPADAARRPTDSARSDRGG